MAVNTAPAAAAAAAAAEETARDARSERAVERMRQASTDARAYGAARKADPNFPHDARWESLQDVLAGKLPVIVHADDLRQINAAVAFAEREKLKLIIAGGYDAPQCAALLEEARHSGHRRRHVSPAAAAQRRLRLGLCRCRPSCTRPGFNSAFPPAAGSAPTTFATCPITPPPPSALACRPMRPSKRSRSIPPRSWASPTASARSTTAKMQRCSSADGDPLDTPTQVTAAWIRGRKVDLNDRHKTLYHKYEEKYKQQ